MSPRACVCAVVLGLAAGSSSGCGRSETALPERAAPEAPSAAAEPGTAVTGAVIAATGPGTAATGSGTAATAPGIAAPPGSAPAPAPSASAAPSVSATATTKPSSTARGPLPDAKPKLKCGRTYCNAAGECFSPSPPRCE
ncbi:hypothetical protein [Sorangium sp. So ce1153]|uniref:hypothetical protein n=1 Tax=Sorangium sp. So ce1153 TaxID=3133333 RepID=UPI003F6037C7